MRRRGWLRAEGKRKRGSEIEGQRMTEKQEEMRKNGKVILQ